MAPSARAGGPAIVTALDGAGALRVEVVLTPTRFIDPGPETRVDAIGTWIAGRVGELTRTEGAGRWVAGDIGGLTWTEGAGACGVGGLTKGAGSAGEGAEGTLGESDGALA